MTEPDVLREQLAAALCKRDRDLPRTWDYEEDYYRALAEAVLPLVEQLTRERDEAQEQAAWWRKAAEAERQGREASSHPAIPADTRDAAIRLVAENQLRRYDEEFDASHLSWRDFEPEARQDVDGLLAAGLLAPVSASDTTIAPEGTATALYQCTATHVTYGKCFLPPNEDDHPWGHENFSGKWPVQPGDFPAADPQTTTA